MESFLSLFLLTTLLALLQGLAALPWVIALDPNLVGSRWRQPKSVGLTLLVILGVGFLAAVIVMLNNDVRALRLLGRTYAAVLQLQMVADLLVLVFGITLWFWPKGGAVALAAFREGIRQPMFWLIVLVGQGVLFISPIVPYFTFGEDLKVVKDLGYANTMLAALVFGVIAASSSISEEIEGRSAITVMSKPVSRRHFLLGKFLGLFLASLVVVALMGWSLNWVVLIKEALDPPITQNPIPDPAWITSTVNYLYGTGEAAEVTRGALLWTQATAETLPGMVLTSGHVMVLLAVAVALATRLPMIVNLALCLTIYFLGNLAPILKEVAARGRLRLVEFMADVFDTLLPGLDLFDMATAVVRDAPLPPWDFALYTANVALYAVMYTAIALFVGLILFEDRDLA